jgi:hypothetical protein
MSDSAARLSFRDLKDLDDASTCIAAACAQVQASGSKFTPAVEALLIRANTHVVRIQAKGEKAYALWMQRHGPKQPEGETLEAAPGESSPRARSGREDEA